MKPTCRMSYFKIRWNARFSCVLAVSPK